MHQQPQWSPHPQPHQRKPIGCGGWIAIFVGINVLATLAFCGVVCGVASERAVYEDASAVVDAGNRD